MPDLIHVLILEDSQDDALLMVRELRRSGLEPAWEQVDSEEDYLARLEPGLDLILSDYSLPQFNGSRALSLLQERRLDIPFILVTGAVSEEVAVACMKQGAADYLLKDSLARLGPAVLHARDQKRLRDEKRAADQALRESERRFRALIEHSSDPITLLAPDGRIVYTSPATTRVLGYAADEILNTRFRDLVHPDDAAAVDAVFAGMTHGAEVPERICCRLRHTDGSWPWIEGTAMNQMELSGVNAIVVNYRDITRRRQAEVEVQRLLEEARASHDRLQRLSRRLVQVQEAERRHIARELHDETGQLLTGLKMMLAMQSKLDAAAARQQIPEIAGLVDEVSSRVRELSRGLRPALLDSGGLVPALRGLVDRFTHHTGVPVDLQCGLAEGDRFPIEIETTIYRVVQEALTNVARHAGVAATARVWIQDGGLSTLVKDLGPGFDPDQILSSTASGGLTGLRERVLLLGGELTLESAPGKGTCISARLGVLDENSPAQVDRQEEDEWLSQY